MAILPAVPGLEMAVYSTGHDLPEYDDDEEWAITKWAHLAPNKRVSKYVECQPGAEFSVRFACAPPFALENDSLSIDTKIDGQSVCRYSLSALQLNNGGGYYTLFISSKVHRVDSTTESVQALQFSSIKKVDDSNPHRIKEDIAALKELGNIVVKVHCSRAVLRDGSPWPSGDKNGTPTEVAEKALKGKAISTGVTYGAKSTQTPSPYVYKIDKLPLAVFAFKYRSRADLQTEMIIPRSPSPPGRRGRGDGGARAGGVPFDREAKLASLKNEIAALKAEDGPSTIKAEESVAGRGTSRKRAIVDDDDVQFVSRAYKTSRRPGGILQVDLTEED